MLPGLSFPNSNVTQAANFPHENQLNGDPEYNLFSAEYNAGYDITPDLEVYSFGTAGYRIAAHYENYRTPSKISGNECNVLGCGVVPGTGALYYPLPLGFDPQEENKELDGSVTVGLKGKVTGWNWDLATTYGAGPQRYLRHQFGQRPAVPGAGRPVDDADRAAAELLQRRLRWHAVDHHPRSRQQLRHRRGVAVERRFRRRVPAGDLRRHRRRALVLFRRRRAVVRRLHAAGPGLASAHQLRRLYRRGGRSDRAPASRLGRPLRELQRLRRREVGKDTARYDFNEMFAIRGTISNGFRAPTLAEEFYSGTNVSPNSAAVSLAAELARPPSSPGSRR